MSVMNAIGIGFVAFGCITAVVLMLLDARDVRRQRMFVSTQTRRRIDRAIDRCGRGNTAWTFPQYVEEEGDELPTE